jgi:putative hydrolase of the HAD superfamily
VETYSGVQHISLDLWLTLIRSNSAFKPARNKLFIECFSIDKPEEEVMRTFQVYDRLFNTINENTGRNLSRFEMLYIILAALGKEIKASPLSKLEQFFAEADVLFFEHPPVVLDPNLTALLAELRMNKVSVSLLSNTGFIIGKTLRTMLPRLGFEGIFDFQIYSDEVEASKPSPQIFKILYTQVAHLKSVAKEEILHIGDNLIADYQGAMDAGFNALLYHPENETLSRLLTNYLCIPPSH